MAMVVVGGGKDRSSPGGGGVPQVDTGKYVRYTPRAGRGARAGLQRVPQAQLAAQAAAHQGVPHTQQHRAEADQGLVPEPQVRASPELRARLSIHHLISVRASAYLLTNYALLLLLKSLSFSPTFF